MRIAAVVRLTVGAAILIPVARAWYTARTKHDRRGLIRALSLTALGIVVCWFLFGGGPPREAKLIRNFHAHRASFESLRDMLQADQQLHRLADWGVDTDKGISKPPAGEFPIDRYNRYLALLKEVGGLGVSRGEGAHANPTVLLWAAGFGGDSVHVGICWLDQEPARQVTSLDQYYRDHKSPNGSGSIYRRIDGSCYLWTDLWSQ